MKELIWYPKIKSQVILHEKDEDYPFGQYAQKKEINDKKISLQSMLRVFRETERREWENFPRGRKYYFELDDDHKIFIDFLERSWTAQVLDMHDPDIHVFHQWRENSSYTREFALSLMSQEKRKFWLKFLHYLLSALLCRLSPVFAYTFS